MDGAFLIVRIFPSNKERAREHLHYYILLVSDNIVQYDSLVYPLEVVCLSWTTSSARTGRGGLRTRGPDYTSLWTSTADISRVGHVTVRALRCSYICLRQKI